MLANPRPIANGNTTRWNRRGSASQYHLTVSKNFWTGRNDPGWSESFEQPVIPPAPLTGDVGRDCGDASRALLFIFFLNFSTQFFFHAACEREYKIRRATKHAGFLRQRILFRPF